MPVQYQPVSWNQYIDCAQQLAEAILTRKPPPDEIVAIVRGGLTLGHILSDHLRIPISLITIQSYTGIKSQGELKLTAKLHASIKGKHVLLVDDVADTGKTFVRAIKYLHRLQPYEISTVSMFYKTHSIYRPDYFAETTSKWVLFPYEPTEMILLLSKSMKKEGKSKAEIQKILESLNYTDDQIAFVRKFHFP